MNQVRQNQVTLADKSPTPLLIFYRQKYTVNTNTIDSILPQPWLGSFGGVPPWNLVNTDEFLPAFGAAIELADREYESIADNPQPPTFENTIVAMENAGRSLDRLRAVFSVYRSSLNTGDIPAIEQAVAPKLSQHADSITQNPQLFERIESIFNSDEMNELSAAQKRLVEDYHKKFVRHGARLNESEKDQLSSINATLANLFTQFNQNVLADEGNYVTWIDNQDDLAGLPQSFIESMAATASDLATDGEQRGHWAVTNTRSSIDPFLTYADNRELRKNVWTNFYNRCDNGDDHDNNGIVSEILKLRAERAILLGYPTHAHWSIEMQMAKTPAAAMDLMLQVWPKAVERVRQEVADMQKIADREGSEIKIEPWDYRYYAEKVRQEKFELDFNEIKPYLQLDNLRDSMFWVAEQLFQLHFERLDNVPVFHPEVEVWEVQRNGDHVGLWYFDPFARSGKHSGAWMSAYRSQEHIHAPISPIVSNNCNYIKGKPGEPVLISWDDATTLFHEFGHALHGLCSQCQYPSQSGTSVARDYVELPSQLLEHWLSTPEVLKKFAIHKDTGDPIPDSLIAKLKKAAKFNQGFQTVEFLAAALIDMKLHLAGNIQIDPAPFERDNLKELDMPSEIVMRHRTPHFSHLFSSDSYSAGYYSYLWADALTADAAALFEESGSYFDPGLAKSLFDNVLSVGDTIDPADGFRKFRGRDVDTRALLEKRGFPVD